MLSHEEAMALIARAQSGDAQALERMVSENLGLVRAVCARFQGRGCESEELYQLGCMGLVKAIRHFKVDLGVRFSTYAVPMVMGEIRRFLRDDGSVSVGRRLKETAARAARVQERLRMELGREPTLQETAKTMEISVQDLALSLESVCAVRSLDAPIGDEDGVTLAEQVGCWQRETDIDRLALKDEIEKLPESDRQLILLRYFRDMTQSQTAKALGMTQVQVSRREARILKQMRENMETG